MNISEASDRSGLPPKTIRYYEEIGLVAPARAENGYRLYAPEDIHRLSFVQRARSLGFTVDECRALLSLYEDDHRASCDVKAMALDKVAEMDAKIAQMRSLRDTLAMLAQGCQGDQRPDCPILEDLARTDTLG
ncbi:MAG: Cu(I)-responsive transcriptional regulator [Pseudomonadota bacterium]